MGKRGGAKKGAPNAASGSNNNTISLREELTGKRQSKGGSSVNAKSALKLEHLQRLAVWAGAEASVPSLGAFFGLTLASAQEGLGLAPDPSLFTCQRCETILQPGFNCTVRIEKNRAKTRRRSKKPTNFTQNNVVYTCNFCSHRNLKRGTPNGHMKVICPPKIKTALKLKLAKSISKKFVSSKKSIVGEGEVRKANEIASSEIARENRTVESPSGEEEIGKVYAVASSDTAREIPTVDSPATPAARTGTTLLLEGKRRKRNKSASKKQAEPENSPAPIDAETPVTTSKKRRRKSWTSLKEIAESSKHNNIRNIGDLKTPFFV